MNAIQVSKEQAVRMKAIMTQIGRDFYVATINKLTVNNNEVELIITVGNGNNGAGAYFFRVDALNRQGDISLKKGADSLMVLCGVTAGFWSEEDFSAAHLFHLTLSMSDNFIDHDILRDEALPNTTPLVDDNKELNVSARSALIREILNRRSLGDVISVTEWMEYLSRLGAQLPISSGSDGYTFMKKDGFLTSAWLKRDACSLIFDDYLTRI